MARVILPRMKRIPDGATKEVRLKMLDEYKAEMARLNPRHFNPDGSQKTFWQLTKSVFT